MFITIENSFFNKRKTKSIKLVRIIKFNAKFPIIDETIDKNIIKFKKKIFFEYNKYSFIFKRDTTLNITYLIPYFKMQKNALNASFSLIFFPSSYDLPL